MRVTASDFLDRGVSRPFSDILGVFSSPESATGISRTLEERDIFLAVIKTSLKLIKMPATGCSRLLTHSYIL